MKYYTFARCSRSARIYLTTTNSTSFLPHKTSPNSLLYNTQHPNARKSNVVLHRSYLFFSSREKYHYLVFEDDTICSFSSSSSRDDDDEDDDDALDVVDDSPPKVAVGATRTTTTTTTNTSGVRARDGRKRAR